MRATWQETEDENVDYVIVRKDGKGLIQAINAKGKRNGS